MKTIVITGAAGGIGSHLVDFFAQNGYTVIGVDKQEISTVHKSVIGISCDLADSMQVQAMTANITNKHPAINGIINCAATQRVASITAATPEDWDATFSVNVKAPWLLLQGLYPSLCNAAKTQGYSTVINIGSVHAHASSHNIAAYAISKAALHGLTRSASIDCAADGIRVHTITPGAVATPMLTEHLDSMQLDKLISRQLTPELIQPEAIAETAAFLMSPAAKNMTGQEITIDSGTLIQLSTEVA